MKLILLSQALTSTAIPSGSSATSKAPRAAGAASCDTHEKFITATFRFHRHGINGCGIHERNPRRWMNSTPMYFGRRG